MADFDRKELKEADAFFEGVGKANRFLTENRNQVLAAAGGVVVLFLGGIAWSSNQSRVAQTASAAFLRATDAVEEDSLESATVALENVVDNDQQPYATLAQLYLGDVQAKQGKFDEASASYEAAASNADRPFLKQIAMVGKGHSLESAGQPSEAALAYSNASGIQGAFRETALRGQLRNARAAENSDLERSALQGLVNDYPDVADIATLSAELESASD